MNREVTLLAWKSGEGASVENSGLVRFEANDDGTARVQVRLSYNPRWGRRATPSRRSSAPTRSGRWTRT